MDRTTSRRLYDEFTSEVDLNRPEGIMRSGEVDAYIEKALKPLIEEGKAFKRVSVDRRTGIRSTRYAYQGGKKVQDSVNAVLAEMPESLGYGVDPATGNVYGTDRPPPMSVTNQGRHYYNETRERILDPRTAASIRADAMRAGGTSTTDKASGYTTTLIRASRSGETRKMRKLVDDTDAKYLAGELPSSALADGARAATIEERARAQVARQAKLKDAKQAAADDYIKAHPKSRLAIEEAIKTQKITDREEKAKLLAAERTPGTPEFQARIFRGLRAQEAGEDVTEKFIKQNPHSRLAVRRRHEKWARRGQKAKQIGGTAVHIIRSAITLVAAAVTAGVGLLAGSYKVITQIGSDIRKRAINEAKFNFAPDTVRGFEIFAAERGGMDKDLLVRAAGGIQNAWSTPLNYADSGFNQLAPYLRENTARLVTMATANGDANVLDIMGNVIDDLVSQSLKGVGGAKTFDPNSAEGRHRAFSANLNALSAHNEAWGELMSLYWNDFIASKASNIGAWKEADKNGQMRSMTFENWVTQADWSKEYDKETGIDSPVIRDAAEETYKLVTNFVGTYSNLGTDIVTGLSAYLGKVVESLRSIIANWLSPYFPAFAMKENRRAEYLNTQALRLARSLQPGYEAEAEQALTDIGYAGNLTQFRGIINALWKGDVSAIPGEVDREALRKNMGVFTRYYHVQDIIADIEAEDAKAVKNSNYVRKHIVGTSSSIAAVSGENALILQYRLDKGSRDGHVKSVKADTQITPGDVAKMAVIAAANVPAAALEATKAAAAAHEPETAELENRIQDNLYKIIPGKRGKIHEFWPVVGVGPQYDEVERDLRRLITLYDKAGHRELAMATYERLEQFYRDYPKELYKEADPKKRQEIYEKMRRDYSWFWFADNFAEAAQVLTPPELADLTAAHIRQLKAQFEYADTQTDLNARSNAQQALTRETTAAGFIGSVNGSMLTSEKFSDAPDLQGMYQWLAKPGNAIHIDAFDESSRRSKSDVIINFYEDGVMKKTLKFDNSYGVMNDVYLTHGNRAGITEAIAASLEAPSEQ
jgi:hypothetical protein